MHDPGVLSVAPPTPVPPIPVPPAPELPAPRPPAPKRPAPTPDVRPVAPPVPPGAASDEHPERPAPLAANAATPSAIDRHRVQLIPHLYHRGTPFADPERMRNPHRIGKFANSSLFVLVVAGATPFSGCATVNSGDYGVALDDTGHPRSPVLGSEKLKISAGERG